MQSEQLKTAWARLRSHPRLQFVLAFVRRGHAVWSSLSLTRQFLIGATAVLLPAMLIAGYWTTRLIRDGVVRNASASAALYMENFVEPTLQSLATSGSLTEADRVQLDALLADSSVRQRVVSVKVWGVGGRVIYSS